MFKKDKKTNILIYLESKSVFEKKRKMVSLTYMCVPPVLIQNILQQIIHKYFIRSENLNMLLEYIYAIICIYLIMCLICWKFKKGNYEQIFFNFEKIGQFCVYALYFVFVLMLCMRVFFFLETNPVNTVQNCQILDTIRVENHNFLEEQYYQLEISFQKEDSDEIFRGVGCRSQNHNIPFWDSFYNTSPNKLYRLGDDSIKLPSWACLPLDIQGEFDMEKQGFESCFFSEIQKNNGEKVNLIQFEESIYKDKDLENFLLYQGITLILQGVLLFIFSLLLDNIDNKFFYKLLIEGKIKYYVKTINCFVTVTSIVEKNISKETAKRQIAKEFQLREDQVVFKLQKRGRRQKIREIIVFIIPLERMLLGLNGAIQNVPLYRKEIAVEMVTDFLALYCKNLYNNNSCKAIGNGGDQDDRDLQVNFAKVLNVMRDPERYGQTDFAAEDSDDDYEAVNDFYMLMQKLPRKDKIIHEIRKFMEVLEADEDMVRCLEKLVENQN